MPAEEQPADRDVAGRAVDHRHDAGRDQVGHGRGAGDQRGGEGAVVALAVHLGRDGAAQHRDVGGRGARDAGEEHAEQGDDLRQPAAQMTDQRLRQAHHPLRDVGRGHQLADQQEERHREQRLGIDAVEHLADHRRQADRGERSGDQHAGHQREGHRHAHVAEPRNRKVIRKRTRHCSFRDPRRCRLGPRAPRSRSRQPLTSCSMANSAISAPESGTQAVYTVERDQRRHAEAAEVEHGSS